MYAYIVLSIVTRYTHVYYIYIYVCVCVCVLFIILPYVQYTVRIHFAVELVVHAVRSTACRAFFVRIARTSATTHTGHGKWHNRGDSSPGEMGKSICWYSAAMNGTARGTAAHKLAILCSNCGMISVTKTRCRNAWPQEKAKIRWQPSFTMP